MGWTKRQFIAQAFEEIGLASYAFDLQPEQEMAALRRLDSMMAAWNAKRIRIGYIGSTSANGSDLDQDAGVPDSANEAIYTNLAIRIAGTVGKVPAPQLAATARETYDTLLAIAAQPRERRLDWMVSGAGNKSITDQNFIYSQTDPLMVGPDAPLEFNNAD